MKVALKIGAVGVVLLATSIIHVGCLLQEGEWTTTEEVQIYEIVGGSQVNPGEYPFMVHLGVCGASLVAKDVILSAAHCSSFPSQVLVGAHKRYTESEYAQYSKVVSNAYKHPAYTGHAGGYDLMLAKIEPVSRSTIEPIALNFDSTIPAQGDWVTVIGFGSTSEGGLSSDSLLEVDAPFVPMSTCNDPQHYGGEIRNENNQFCAGEAGIDSCQGDSGGPIFKDIGGVPTLLGTVSWGRGCARDTHPGVYSKTSAGATWLKNTICNLSDYPPSFCSNLVPGPIGCTHRFNSMNNHEFYFCNNYKTWNEAKAHCHSIGATWGLVRIGSSEENTWVMNKGDILLGNNALAWTGGTDRGGGQNEGIWIWEQNGQRIRGYTNWGRNQPNNKYNEDCLGIYVQPSGPYAKGQWNDKHCTLGRNYICENSP